MRKAKKNIIKTIKFDLQRYFVAKQQKHLIIQFVIKRYITKRFYLRANT